MSTGNIRNIAIIAHVDHGKTTLVDQLLYQSGMFRQEDLDKLAGGQHNLIMDSNDLERERGITILAKNCAIDYTNPQTGDTSKINIIDTPGHADFGGEVERVLMMADGVCLVVDAFEGPMPQTRFVLGKALSYGLKPVVIINKADRPDARPEQVVDEVFDLLVDLDANDDALDFPIIYASAKNGWASDEPGVVGENMQPVYQAIIKHIKPAEFDPNAPLQMLVTTLDYSDYVGRIGIGRVIAGTLKAGERVSVVTRDGKITKQKIAQIQKFKGLGKEDTAQIPAGDICAVIGIDPIDIGDTIADLENPVALPPINIDQPTLHMTFSVNTSPFSGQDGKFVTSRQIAARLEKELQSNVALRVSPGNSPEEFNVSGRGLMHLGILLENMRREGFELASGKPEVINKIVDGKEHEPIENLVVDCPSECQSSVMAVLGDRRAEMTKMDAKPGAAGFVHLEFSIPSRGLIGIRTRMLNATQGKAIVHHSFSHYEPMRGEIPKRKNGVMISNDAGQVTPYALDALYERGFFFSKPGDQVYAGQIIGEHCKDGDITVNCIKGKQLTNVRTSNKDDAAKIRPAREMSLEACLEYIQDDELVEITPNFIRMRKRILGESMRKRETRIHSQKLKAAAETAATK